MTKEWLSAEDEAIILDGFRIRLNNSTVFACKGWKLSANILVEDADKYSLQDKLSIVIGTDLDDLDYYVKSKSFGYYWRELKKKLGIIR